MVINNTIYNTDIAVARAEEVVNNIITNATNVFSRKPSIASNNLFWQNGEDETCTGCINADPLFINADSGDFRLHPESPAVDNGTVPGIYDTFFDLYGMDIKVDFYGQARPQTSKWDIGPFEQVGTGVQKLFLTVNIIGSGSVQRDPDSSWYSLGTEVSLTAIPSSDQEFTRWEGDLSGTTNPQTIIMDSHKNVSAIFGEQITEEFVVDTMETQSGVFEARWNAYSTVDLVDGVIGFSEKFPNEYSHLSCKIQFSNTGFLKVNNNTTYTADVSVPYVADQLFKFRMIADIDNETYSIWVTPEGESEVQLADNYEFAPGPGEIDSIKYRSTKV